MTLKIILLVLYTSDFFHFFIIILNNKNIFWKMKCDVELMIEMQVKKGLKTR